MASQAARFLVQADVLPSLAAPLWNSSWLLDNGSVLGRLLHTLVGYDATPLGIQVIFYAATLALILTGMRLTRMPTALPKTT
jgi:high-affinity iron transporter